MEQTVKSVQGLNRSGRWDYRFHQHKFAGLQDRLSKSPYPLYTLKDVTTQVVDGTHFTPHYTDDSGVLFLMARNVRPFEIVLDEVSYITREEHQKIIRCKPEAGDVLVTKDGTIGVAAVVPGNLPEFNIFVSVIKVRPSPRIAPHYLATILNSEIGQLQMEQQIKGASIIHIHLEDIRRVKLPLPPRDVQDRIAGVMQAAYAARREKLAEAGKLLGEVDDLVFGKLDLSPESVREETRFLKPVSALQSGRFDVAFNMGFHKFDPYADRVVQVGDVVLFSKETKNPTKEPNTSFRYIDISSINIATGEIVEPSEMLGEEAPSRARQVIHAGDILVSTVRPTRGAIATVPPGMEGFICSTGFAVIRPTENVLTDYLHTALRLSTTLEQFGRRSAGSSYPAIIENDIKVTLIPLPTKEQQKEIAEEITRRRAEAKRLRAEAEQVVAEAKARVERMLLGEEGT